MFFKLGLFALLVGYVACNVMGAPEKLKVDDPELKKALELVMPKLAQPPFDRITDAKVLQAKRWRTSTANYEVKFATFQTGLVVNCTPEGDCDSIPPYDVDCTARFSTTIDGTSLVDVNDENLLKCVP